MFLKVLNVQGLMQHVYLLHTLTVFIKGINQRKAARGLLYFNVVSLNCFVIIDLWFKSY